MILKFVSIALMDIVALVNGRNLKKVSILNVRVCVTRFAASDVYSNAKAAERSAVPNA